MGSFVVEPLIRRCESEDLANLLQIENQSYSHPWTEQQFRHELQTPHSRVDLLLIDEQIAGYICYWLLVGEMHILNIATAPAYRRTGVAHRLLTHAFIRAQQTQVAEAYLEVRKNNLGAIALYHAFGFIDGDIRRGYYSDGEDALLMHCPLDSKKSGD
jgi:ribosomal-protein-alanine N-acetyltransferase